MKIITPNCVYIQKSDLEFLEDSDFYIPSSFGIKSKEINDFRFFKFKSSDFIKITDPSDMEFISRADYIVNYDELKKYSIEELEQMITDLLFLKYEIRLYYYSLDSSDKMNNYDLIRDCHKLNYKIIGITNFIKYLKAELFLQIPTLEESDFKARKRNCRINLKR